MNMLTKQFIGFALILFSFLTVGWAQDNVKIEEVMKPEKVKLPNEARRAKAASKVLDERWLKLEVKFSTEEEITEEITVKFYIDGLDSLKDDKLVILTAQETYIDLPKSNEHYAAVFMHPATVERFGGTSGRDGMNKANVHVEILEGSRSVDEKSHDEKDREGWHREGERMEGRLVRLKDSPFWPSESLRYNQVKPDRR